MKKFLILALSVAVLVSCSKDEDTTPQISPVSAFTFTADASDFKTIQFQNSSHYLTNKSKYIWTFGDGDSALIENPNHQYKAMGTYQVVLKVVNGSLSDCATKQVTITDKPLDSTIQAPNVTFVLSQDGKTVYLQNTTSGVNASTTYSWNFGDGETANLENTTHVYNKNGMYNIVLKVTLNYKSYSYSRSLLITDSSSPQYDTIAPQPMFTFSYKGENMLNFINASSFTTGATKYVWYFGDGSTSTDENPQHTFTTNGDYNVVLKVTNNNYTVSYTKNVQVPAQNNANYDWSKKPTAKFVFSQDGHGFYFQNASSNINTETKYFWTLGDGETSTDENFSWIYTKSGKYYVVLKVTNGTVSDSYALEITIP